MALVVYNPYPTIADLRTSGAELGQTDPATLFDQQVFARRDVLLAEHLRRLGIKIPKAPANMTDTQKKVWGMLVNFDLIAGYLSVAYEQLALMLGRTGAALCEDLNRYNQVALWLYREQEKVVEALHKAKVPGAPASPPFPKLFVPYGVNKGATDYEVKCDAGSPYVFAAPDTNDRGVRMQMAKPCPELGAGPAAGVYVLVLGATAIISYFGFGAWEEVARQHAQVDIAAENTKKGLKMAEYQAARSIMMRKLLEKCIAAGGDPVQCLATASNSLPKDIKALNPDEWKSGKRGFFFWLGIVGGLGALGGLTIWAIRKKNSAPRRQLPARRDDRNGWTY